MSNGRWVHLTVAPDQITGEIWVDVLRSEGINAMIRPSDTISWLGVSAMGCRIQVLESEHDQAVEILEGLSLGEIDGEATPET